MTTVAVAGCCNKLLRTAFQPLQTNFKNFYRQFCRFCGTKIVDNFCRQYRCTNFGNWSVVVKNVVKLTIVKFRHRFFWSKIFLVENFFRRKTFWSKINFRRKKFRRKSFSTKKIFDEKNRCPFLM